jgi:hypothetical protein
MAVYFIDHAGDGSDGLTWEKAYQSFKDAAAAGIFATANTIYVGADHACPATHSANLDITCPGSGAPVVVISSTVGTGTDVSYSVATADQIDTTEGAYRIYFDGCVALYGIQAKSGGVFLIAPDANETALMVDCKIKPAAGAYLEATNNSSHLRAINLTMDLSQDTGNSSTGVFGSGTTAFEIIGFHS